MSPPSDRAECRTYCALADSPEGFQLVRVLVSLSDSRAGANIGPASVPCRPTGRPPLAPPGATPTADELTTTVDGEAQDPIDAVQGAVIGAVQADES